MEDPTSTPVVAVPGAVVVVESDYFPPPPNSQEGDPLLARLRSEARVAASSEPAITCLLQRTVLHPSVDSFESAVAHAVSHRLASVCGSDPDVCPELVRDVFVQALTGTEPELGHTAGYAMREDAVACVNRDPACETLLEAVLFFKGFAAIVAHRAARRRWFSGSRFVALWLQSQASAAFGVDIHPAAAIGGGVMIDHATGVVIGETARVGDGCTLLHGVTLGGTGKDTGDRHPKVGRDVLIGANASVLGNITLGDGAKIGAGSVVLRPVPHGATAVGVPAKIIGWARERDPGSAMDSMLMDVVTMGKAGGGDGSNGEGGEDTTRITDSMTSLTTLESAEASSAEDLAATATQDNEEGYEKEEGEEGVKEEEEDEESAAEEDGYVDVVDGDRAEATEKEAKEGDATAEDALGELPSAPPVPMPQRHRSKSFPPLTDDDGDVCSLFRGFRLRRVPPGGITYCALRALLLGEGCTDAEAGEVFFELLHLSDHPELRYVPARVFREHFQDVAGRFTRIDPSRCEEISRGVRSYKKGRGGGGARSCVSKVARGLGGLRDQSMACVVGGKGEKASLLGMGAKPMDPQRKDSLQEDLPGQVVDTALRVGAHRTDPKDSGTENGGRPGPS